MKQDTPRHEFRVFADDLAAVAARLAGAMNAAGSRDGEEIYLLPRRGDDTNVKVRDGAVEIKRLHLRRDGLEQWKPDGRLELPVERSVVVARILPALGIDAGAGAGLPDTLALDDLLQTVTAAGAEAIRVRKRRRLFAAGGLRAEHARVEVLGASIDTIALESPRAAEVLAARRRFGLDQRENLHYVAMLRRRRAETASAAEGRHGSHPHDVQGREIERKFRLVGDGWRTQIESSVAIRQGYLTLDPERTVRVRLAAERGALTIKGRTHGAARAEYEWEIPAAEARALLDTLCLRPLIEKTRHRIAHDGRVWEVDEFSGDNRGLIVAEVELEREDEEVALPEWVEDEVTGDPRYYNASLVRRPFGRWAGA